MKSCTSELERSRTTCVPPRPRTISLFGAFNTHSGCFSYNSLVVLAISGSIQIPNLIPCLLASAIRPSMPLGSFRASTIQSPKDELSLLRGYLSPNQPSSMTNNSPPIDWISLIIWSIPSWLISKYTPSQLFSKIFRAVAPFAILCLRAHAWKFRLLPLKPSLL